MEKYKLKKINKKINGSRRLGKKRVKHEFQLQKTYVETLENDSNIFSPVVLISTEIMCKHVKVFPGNVNYNYSSIKF